MTPFRGPERPPFCPPLSSPDASPGSGDVQPECQRASRGPWASARARRPHTACPPSLNASTDMHREASGSKLLSRLLSVRHQGGDRRVPPKSPSPPLSPGFAVLVLTSPGDKTGRGSRGAAFYSELWFIVAAAILGLVLLAIFLSLILQRKIQKEPYVRERPPLVPAQKRMSALSVYPPGEPHVVRGPRRPPPPHLVTGPGRWLSCRGERSRPQGWGARV